MVDIVYSNIEIAKFELKLDNNTQLGIESFYSLTNQIEKVDRPDISGVEKAGLMLTHLIAQGNLQEAKDFISNMPEEYYKSSKICGRCAYLFFETGEYEKATEVLKRANIVSPLILNCHNGKKDRYRILKQVIKELEDNNVVLNNHTLKAIDKMDKHFENIPDEEPVAEEVTEEVAEEENPEESK